MEVTREDASGTPLLVDRKMETTIDIEPPLTPVLEDNDKMLAGSGVAKKKTSLSRKFPPLTKLNMMSQTMNPSVTRNQPYTPQANSPLRQFSLHQTLGSTDLKEAYKTIVCLRIYFPHLFVEEGDDNTSTCLKFKVNCIQTAEEILMMIADSLHIPAADVSEAFALWMVSPLLELQLKPHHQPCALHKSWANVLAKFAADAPSNEIQADAPVLYIKRKVQLAPERELELATSPTILNLLYNDAKWNLFADRYYMTPTDAAALAGIGFAIDNEKENMTLEYIRKNLETQLPDHLADSIRGPMMFGKTLSNGRELETVLSTWKTNQGNDKDRLKRLFLGKLHTSCNQYGSAFFHGFIERPSISPLKNLKRFFQTVAAGDGDMEVTIGVNRDTITVIDKQKLEIILMVRISDCVWMKIGSKQVADDAENPAETQPTLLLHFPEFNAKGRDKDERTNVLQVFGFQTILIHSMLSNMQGLIKKENSSEPNSASSTSSSENGQIVTRTPSLTKCDRMCLATFVNGKCVKANGSMKKAMQMQSVH